MTKKLSGEISRAEIVANSILRLDMSALNGRGLLRRPVKDLLKVILHRMGVQYSLEELNGRWRAKTIVRGRRKSSLESWKPCDSPEQAENEFFILVMKGLPEKLKSAFSRDN